MFENTEVDSCKCLTIPEMLNLKEQNEQDKQIISILDFYSILTRMIDNPLNKTAVKDLKTAKKALVAATIHLMLKHKINEGNHAK